MGATKKEKETEKGFSHKNWNKLFKEKYKLGVTSVEGKEIYNAMSQDEKNTLKNEYYLHRKGLGEYINSNNKYYKIIDQQLKLKDEFNYATDIRKKPMDPFHDFLMKNGYNPLSQNK